MRWTSRAALVAAASIPLAAVAPPASAATASDVTYNYSVNGSTVTNTITNNSGTPIGCATSLAPAPGGILPPVEDVLRAGQSLYANGEVQPGTSTQTVTDVPDGSYVVLASCGLTDPMIWWVSDYPGIADYLTQIPGLTAFTVQQESTVVTIPATTPPTGGNLPDPGAIFGS
ncbi:hypothetical protein [Rhodococcus maanshanensis]|uniref:Uncharacterized protein n=1 Tax=Rhodococcus maanshanensis TaxID=183556 RepID=A0A1H7YLY5_9NOCA|nr:hypothetical protein [Rhodococcus maanshanensis]SEM47252.1 hypothetical protein SAMN05444583_14212 [Rhodococcus maanshanensis]